MSSFFVKKLREFMRGKIDRFGLERSDRSVEVKKYNSASPAQSELKIKFDNDEELLKAVGLNQDDISFYYQVKNPHHGGEVYDGYTAEDDFIQGYGPWYYFDFDNEEKLEQIAKIIYPEQLNTEDETSKEKFSRKLKNLFPKVFNEIVNEYAGYRNDEMITSSEKIIDDELANFGDDLDLRIVGESVITSAANLFGLYAKLGLLDYPPTKLVEAAFQGLDYDMGRWTQSFNFWEFSDDKNFDKEGFNSQVSRDLDKLIDEIYDTDKFPYIKDFVEMEKRISSKFKIGKWFPLPKDKSKQTEVKIKTLEPETNKIVVSIRKGLKMKEVKLSEQNFYNLLYQPELFQFGELYNL